MEMRDSPTFGVNNTVDFPARTGRNQTPKENKATPLPPLLPLIVTRAFYTRDSRRVRKSGGRNLRSAIAKFLVREITRTIAARKNARNFINSLRPACRVISRYSLEFHRARGVFVSEASGPMLLRPS